MNQTTTNKIILALDTSDLNFAIDIAKKIIQKKIIGIGKLMRKN